MITKEHWHEWKQSGVDNQLVNLNVISLFGDEVFEYLLFGLPNTERRNDYRLRDKWLKRYNHLPQGGWWCSGLDPLNNWHPMEWGRLKPSAPKLNTTTNKPIKYESPPKVPNRVTYFNVPPHLWEQVALRYQIQQDPPPSTELESLCFWEWVQKHPEIPIILTEGEKKAACLLSLGFVAIALPGIWNGRVGQKDFNEFLHPDLMPMAQPGRKFFILFDYETKPKTQYALYQASLRTARVIEAAGCACEVALLPGPEKGVDDFVVARGAEASHRLETILDDALSPKDYQRRYRLSLRGLGKYRPHLKVKVPYLSEAVRLPEEGLVVLSSEMGTGKTELLRRWRLEHPEERFLNNGHRVNLLKNLAKRLETEMYSTVSYGDLSKAKALSITVDSLHKLTHAVHTYDCVFIDEACQYLAHLLHSQTCKEFRAEILEVLEYLVGKAKLVVIADAHMDEVTIDFFAAMRPNDTPFIIKNTYKNGGRPLVWYSGRDSSQLVAQISAALLAGQKIMVVSDSKRFIKKLEAAMTVEVSESPTPDSKDNGLRVWSVHSENSGSPENVAFIEDISHQVKNLDVLLASPSLGTGVDLPDYHFDLIFGAFHGVSQTATECAQALHRYRPHVPMHIWVASRPPFGYRETNAAKIKQRMLESNQMTAFLIRLDKETGTRGAEKDWALDAYCRIEAARNLSLNNLRQDLRLLLEQMGHTIQAVVNGLDPACQEQMRKAGLALDAAYLKAVATAECISSAQYQARQTKDYLTPEEIYECEKYRIGHAYGLLVTEELIQQDDQGRFLRKLAALEAVLSPSLGTLTDPDSGKVYPLPPELVSERDLSDRQLFPLAMDWGNYSAQWLARQLLGVPGVLSRLLTGAEVTATDPELVKMCELAVACRIHIKAILGFTIPADCRPMWLLGVLLDQLGLKLISRKRGPRKQQVRYYSLDANRLHFALTVLTYREQQRAEKERQRLERLSQSALNPVSTPFHNGSGSTLEGGVDTSDDPTHSPFSHGLERLEEMFTGVISAMRDYSNLLILKRWPWVKILIV